MEPASRLLLAALLWATAAFGLWLCRRKSPLHLLVLSLGGTALIGSFYPVLSLATQARTWRNVDGVGEEVLLATQADFLAFAAGLVLAALLLPRCLRADPPLPGARSASPRVRQRDTLMALGLIGLGACLYALYVQRVGLAALTDRGDYAGKYLVSRGLGPLRFGILLAIAGCLWAEAGAVSRRVRWVARAAGAAIAVWTLGFISVRTNLVVLLAGYGWIGCARHGVQLRRLRPALVVLGLAAWAGLETFALFRGAYRGDVLEALAVVGSDVDVVAERLVGRSELAHPFITAMEVADAGEPASLLGASYVRSLGALVPLALAPDRAPTLSEEFARVHYVDLFQRGGGTAFSIVAEAWLNFGPIAGPLLLGLALGLAKLAVERRCARAPESLLARCVPFCVFLMVVEHRSEAAVVLKQLVALAAPVLLLALAAELVWLAGARRPRGRPAPLSLPARSPGASA